MIVETEKMFDGKSISYSVEDNGYTIYLDNSIWITQPEPYSKLYVPNGTYEENAIAQIESICTPLEEADNGNIESGS